MAYVRIGPLSKYMKIQPIFQAFEWQNLGYEPANFKFGKIIRKEL